MGEPGPDAQGWLSRTVTVTTDLGLHARPAARFVKLAGSFAAEIEVANANGRVSGRSILGLMMLAAGAGSVLMISARGADAEAALDALERLVTGGFEED